MNAPLLLSHVALVGRRRRCRARSTSPALLRARQLPVPADGASHLSVDLGGLRLRWEQHGEFHTCTFWQQLAAAPEGFAHAAARRRAGRLACRRCRASGWSACTCSSSRRSRRATELPPLVRSMLNDDSLVGARVMRRLGRGLHRLPPRTATASRAGSSCAGDMNAAPPRPPGAAPARDRDLPHDGAARPAGGARGRRARWSAPSATWPTWPSSIRTAARDDEPELLRRLTQLAARGRGPVRPHARALLGQRRLLRAGAAAHRRTARGARAQPADAARVHGPPPAAGDADLRLGRAAPAGAVASASRASATCCARASRSSSSRAARRCSTR